MTTKFGEFEGRLYTLPTDPRPTVKLSDGTVDFKREGDDTFPRRTCFSKSDRAEIAERVEHPGAYALKTLKAWTTSRRFKSARFYRVPPSGYPEELTVSDLVAILGAYPGRG
jgi:hypothetical protein